GAEPMSLPRIARLEPGQRQTIEGEFRLPLASVVPIRQGRAALFLPLARFQADSSGSASVIRTFVIAQPGRESNGRLQPFRLDIGPRNYPDLDQRAFA